MSSSSGSWYSGPLGCVGSGTVVKDVVEVVVGAVEEPAVADAWLLLGVVVGESSKIYHTIV